MPNDSVALEESIAVAQGYGVAAMSIQRELMLRWLVRQPNARKVMSNMFDRSVSRSTLGRMATEGRRFPTHAGWLRLFLLLKRSL